MPEEPTPRDSDFGIQEFEVDFRGWEEPPTSERRTTSARVFFGALLLGTIGVKACEAVSEEASPLITETLSQILSSDESKSNE